MRPDQRWRLLQQLLKTGDARLRQALWRLLRDRQLQQRVSALAPELARSLTQLLESGGADGGQAFNRQLRDLKLLRRLLLDERVPLWQKAIPVAAALYLVSPLDLVPDFLPLVGQLDDLAVLLGSLRLFRSLVPQTLIEEHLAHIDGEVVDAPGWRTGTLAGSSTGTGTFAPVASPPLLRRSEDEPLRGSTGASTGTGTRRTGTGTRRTGTGNLDAS